MGILTQVVKSAVIEPGSAPETHSIEIPDVLPGDFCAVSVNTFSGPGGAVKIISEAVGRAIPISGPGPYTLVHSVTLQRTVDAVVQCNLVALHVGER